MSRARIETRQLAREFGDRAKLTPEQAEALADVFAEALREDRVTKRDLEEFEQSITFNIGVTLVALVGFLAAMKYLS
jgi:tagatose-1,6-bisphosphate aldolase